MVMDWASARQAMTSGPAYTYNVGAGHSSNDPPGQHVWEEDRRDEPTVSVDYTTPVDTGQGDTGSTISTVDEVIHQNLPVIENLQQNLPVIENLGSSNLEKLLSDEERKWNFLNALQNEWIDSGSNPLYPYDENYPALGVSSPFAMQGMEFDPYTGEWYTTQGGNISPAWQKAEPFEVGSQLVDGEWKKPILSGIGQELFNYDWTDGGENPYGTIPNPEDIGFREDEEGNIIHSPILEKMGDISKDYHRRREQDWDSWADPWYEGHYQGQGGGYDDSISDLARHYWFSESLDDVTARKEERRKAGLGAAGMRASEMEQMYGRDFAAKANPHHDPGYSQAVTSELDPIYGSRLLWETARME